MTSALELLAPDEDYIPSLAEKYWCPASFATFGFVTACLINFGTRRPVFSGIQKHVMWTVSFAILGKYVDQRRDAYFAERDAVLRRYVELHPDDFPTSQRKKYGEVLEMWVPTR